MVKASLKILINENEFLIADDTPDFSNILSFVLDNPDVDLSVLEVACENDKFDKEIFRDTLIETLSDIMEKLKLEEEIIIKKIEQHN